MDCRTVIREAGILLILAVLIAFSVNYLSPGGIPLFGEWKTSRGIISANPSGHIPGDGLEIKDAFSAKRIFDEGRAIFVDARPLEVYNEGHITGAVSLPVHEFAGCADAFFETYPPFTPLVTYCSGQDCGDSFDLAKYLMDAGYSDVRVFVDGYSGWIKEGYPVEQ